MNLTTRTIPQLFNGVSRQPPILRSMDQMESELNSWAAVSQGVGKRPPTEHVAKVANSVGANAFIHTINRDVSERYVVIVDGGTIKVVGFDGVERVVNAPGGLGYLAGDSFAAVTVADYTFIVNRSKTVSMKAAGADTTVPPDYLVNVNRVPQVNEATLLLILAGMPYQQKPNPAYTNTGTITGRVASVEKLPETATDGTIYEVQGSTANPFSSFFVVRNGQVWDETVKPGLKNALDETTMPHCLIREGDGTFTFVPFSWAPRRVGDDKTNPPPTFINRKLRDVFFYQNRLAFLVDENVILSGAGDFGNFWRNTVLDVIDSDVVDVAITSNQVSILDHAVLFNDGALLFADQTQFSMSNGELGVTPASMSIRPITHYTMNRQAKAVPIGTEVYFCSEASGHTVVYEYTRLQDADATTAADITAHVPGLLPSGVSDLCSGTRSLFAFYGTEEAFAYQLYWNKDEKLMSAWRPWSFRGKVRASASLDDSLYLVMEHGGELHLERMNLIDGAKPDHQPKQVYLDRRAEFSGSYDAVEDKTTFVLPYKVPVEQRSELVVVAGNADRYPHRRQSRALIEWDNSVSFKVKGKVEGPTCVGFEYPFHIEFSQQFPVDYQGRPLTSGRLQLRSLELRYSDSGNFDVIVYPYGKEPSPSLEGSYPRRVAHFTGKRLGTDETILGQPSYLSGSFHVALSGDSRKVVIRVENNSYMGSTFSSAEWDGLYNSKALG